MAKLQSVSMLAPFREIVYAILSFVVVVCLTPLILLICIPIYTFRILISLISKIVRPDLESMFDVRSTIFGTEDIYNAPNSTLIITHIFESGAELERIAQEFEKIFAIRRSNGTLKYKQLREYVTKWMGFVFWARDVEFDLKNHIKEISLDQFGRITRNNANFSSAISSEEIKLIEKQLIGEAYYPKRSPWEAVIVRNVKPKFAQSGEKYDAIMFKCHHALADGYSLMKMFTIDVSHAARNSITVPEFPKRSIFNQALLHLYADIRAPFDIMSQVLWKPEQNALHLPPEKLFGNTNFHLVESNRIPIEFIRNIKKQHGIQFKTVVLEACTLAVRKLMLKRKVTIPESITCMIPFPFPGHPDKIGNFWSVMAVSLPIGVEDRQDRLKMISNNLQELRHSTEAITAFKVQPLIGGLFHWQVKPMGQLHHFTGLISDFPGPTKPISAFGCKLVDAYFTAGFPRGNVGMLFFSTSYNGHWKINVLVDHGIMSTDGEVQELIDNIMSEISSLGAESIV